MDVIVAGMIVLGAGAFIAVRAWRVLLAARKPKPGCGSDCGCGH